ncbi:uncharacterized protein LOC113552198 [Rhopalosiphum maidis]|uniref:uncharacterized protein LOC113552198 n=1 Tax=Rhopalosiphum maidis TaxID=43146 RepID=UPI000EFE53B0|nr:uncharacterized protein LOC113552198 [Rhopalosiphum maidis]XP_026810745.1 uncharacterized protein LOC113552198 [Rhopalosiphum maidis]
MEEIIVAPWSSDSEWQSLRQDIYGTKDIRNYKQALRKLLLWKSRGRSLSRGLYCTEMILQVIIKDVHFYEVDELISESDLIRLYSMAIMKFVNLTADVLGKGPQKSMYYRASRLELPSWLIDMRHKISHDQDLPSLKSLRAAMEFALDWLKTKYWNEDDNFLVIAKKLNMNIVDEFIELLEFYMLSKSQTNSTLKEKQLNVLREKLTLSECSSNKECIKKMKDLLANKSWSSDLVNVFTTRYLLQARECSVSKGRISKTDKAIWNVLLKTLNSSGLLTNVLLCLVTQHSRIAALWVLELCIVAYKSSKKIDLKNNQNDNCMNCKPLNLDTNLVLRTALQSPHPFTNIFLKWLLQIQLNPFKVKQQYNIIKLIALYTGTAKVNSKNIDQKIYTIDDLISKDENHHQSQWTRVIGQMNWKQIPFGTTL